MGTDGDTDRQDPGSSPSGGGQKRVDESQNDSVRIEDICLSPIRSSFHNDSITNEVTP